MTTFLGIASLAVALAVIVFALWRLLPENRENRDERWIYGNEYRVRVRSQMVGLTLTSDDIEFLEANGLLRDEPVEFLISASLPEDIEDVERAIACGRYELIWRKERNYRMQ